MNTYQNSYLQTLRNYKMNIPEKEKGIMQKLIDHGFTPYVIGGAVRDSLLGEVPHDWDIFCDATGEEILSIFPEGKVLGGEERQAKILTVVVDGVEVSQFRSNGDRTETGTSLEEHQATCDLTINSIACDIEGKLTDPNCGHADLFGAPGKSGPTIKFVGNIKDRLQEDPLRLLRAIRFCSKYGVSVDLSEVTFEGRQMLIDNIAKERIRDEFLKIINYDEGLENLHYCGLLTMIIPMFSKNIGVDGGDNHAEPVHRHQFNAFNEAKKISNDWRIWLAAFLHDIGKGEAYTKIDGKIQFLQHEIIGYKYVKDWMKEYKFSEDDIKFVSTLIKMHMWGYKEEFSKKTFTKKLQILRDSGVSIYQFLMVCYCDHQGNEKKIRIKFGDFVNASYLLKNYEVAIKENTPFKITDLDIDGHIVMKMGFEGPQIGKVLNTLFDLVCEGTIDNKRDQLIIEARKLK